jgi:hypothetical protein
LHVQIWSDGYFFSGNKFSAEQLFGQYFGRKLVRPNYFSAEHLFGRTIFRPKDCLYITDTSIVECFSQICVVVSFGVCRWCCCWRSSGVCRLVLSRAQRLVASAAVGRSRGHRCGVGRSNR